MHTFYFINTENQFSQFSAFTMDVIARCAFGMKIADLGAEDVTTHS